MGNLSFLISFGHALKDNYSKKSFLIDLYIIPVDTGKLNFFLFAEILHKTMDWGWMDWAWSTKTPTHFQPELGFKIKFKKKKKHEIKINI